MDVLYVKIEILESQNETFKTENSTLKSENSMLKMLLKENIAFTNRIVEILAKMDVLLENNRHHQLQMSHSDESHKIENVSEIKMDVLEESSNENLGAENQNPNFGRDASHLDEIPGDESRKTDLSDHQLSQKSSETNNTTAITHQNESSSHDLGAIDLNGLQDFDIDLPGLTCGTGITQMKSEYQYSQIEPMTPPSEPPSQQNEHLEHIVQSEHMAKSDHLVQTEHPAVSIPNASSEHSTESEQLYLGPPIGEKTLVLAEPWQNMQNVPLQNTEVIHFKEEYQQYGQQPMTPPCEPPLVQPYEQLPPLPLSEHKPNNQTIIEPSKKGSKAAKNGKPPSRKKQKIEHDNPYFAQNDHGYFICPYDTCSTTMKHRHALVEHIRIHTGEKPFKCAICSKRFRCAGTIRKHLKTVHKSEMASERSHEISQLSLQMTSPTSDEL